MKNGRADRSKGEKERQRRADTQFREKDHPLRDNLGARQPVRKPSGRGR